MEIKFISDVKKQDCDILLVNMFTTLDTYTDLCTFQPRYKNRKRYENLRDGWRK